MMIASTLAGIGFGLCTAFCQSIFYIFTRRFVSRTGKTPMLLLIVSHVQMGLACLLLLLLLRPQHLPPLETYAAPLAGSACFYLVAQFGLFWVLQHVESSRVAPLLGGKIVVLALIGTFVLRQNLLPTQWIAVGGYSLAAWLLNEAGGRVPLSCLIILSLTILGYCLSDISATVLTKRLAEYGTTMPLVCASLTYLLGGLLVLPFALQRDAFDRQVWQLALPSAATWFVAMCFLFACFGTIGFVFGNIIQSTRGILSVVLGWAVAHIGHTSLEAHVPRRVFWRRVGGATLMLLAVALYVWRR